MAFAAGKTFKGNMFCGMIFFQQESSWLYVNLQHAMKSSILTQHPAE
jgi:hypothetical protein